jgi:hypothetical protein
METHSLDEMFEFLDIAQMKGHINGNTVVARRTACKKLFTVLDPDQRTIEYVAGNLDVIRNQFQKLHPGVLGTTVEEYARRASLVIADFEKWSKDRAAWEKEIAAKATKSNGDGGEKRAKSEKPKRSVVAATETDTPADARTITVPLGSGFEATVTFPKDLTFAQVKRLAFALAPYASDWDPEARPPQQVLPMQVDRDDGRY